MKEKLDWDRPLREMLPEFVLRDPMASTRATTRDLVTHRTGMPRHDRIWYRAGRSRLDAVKLLRELEPSRDFRSAWQYNNLMFLTAGVVTERVSGQSWEDFTRERVFRPLGMTTSVFTMADARKQGDLRLALHPDRRQATQGRVLITTTPSGQPAASSRCAEEMARYLRVPHRQGAMGWQASSLGTIGPDDAVTAGGGPRRARCWG